MAKVYDRCGVWYYETSYFDQQLGEHTRVQRSTRIKNDGTKLSKKTAERVARDMSFNIADGRGRDARGCSLQEAFEKLLAQRELAQDSSAAKEITITKSVHVMSYFSPSRDVVNNPITTAELREYATDARLTRAIATVSREIIELKLALKAAGCTTLPESPKLGTAPSKELWLDAEATAKLFAELPSSHMDHAVVHRLAGLRYEELYKLEKQDLLPTGLLRVRGTKTSEADRTLPMHPQVKEILLRRAELYPTGRLFPDRWLNSNGGRDMTSAAVRAGLVLSDRVTFNVLRASFCTELVLSGVPLKKIAKLMGHSSTVMVERVYTRFFGSEMNLNFDELLKGYDL